MIDGFRWDDASIDLTFEDSRGRTKEVCLVFPFEGDEFLIFGATISGGRSRGDRIRPEGWEERAFVGLLERWYQQTTAAQEWNRRIEAAHASGKFFPVNEHPPPDRATLLAVMMMRALRNR